MIVADYKPEHGKEILDGKMNKGAPHHISKYLDFAESLYVPGQSFSAIDNGHLIACGGIKQLWPGVAEVWFLSTDKVHHQVRPIVKIVFKYLKILIEEQELVRIQSAVRADWPEAQRFAQFIGLENEGLMKKYGPDGSDYFRFAKVF
tara:strand:+ start:454 stop:894 length:441 start_codon:yes stop_codon:yes gene_type:complete